MVLFPLVVYPLVSLLMAAGDGARTRPRRGAPLARGDRRSASRSPTSCARRLARRAEASCEAVALATGARHGAAAVERARSTPWSRSQPGRGGGAPPARDLSTTRRATRRAQAHDRVERGAGRPLPRPAAARASRVNAQASRPATRVGGYLLSKLLPLIVVVDGDAGRVLSRHRHHRRRARARHARDDAVGARSRAPRSDDRQGAGGRDAVGAHGPAQPRRRCRSP